MNFLKSKIKLQITSADSIRLIDSVVQKGISLSDIIYVDDLTVQFCVFRKDYKKVMSVVVCSGAVGSILELSGSFWSIKRLAKRPVLLIGISFLLFLVLYLPTKVLFIGVSGNQNIPAGKILEAAEECGIYFGVSRKTIRSEKMKNHLLAKVPELQWAGINTYGCLAVISVEEKTEPDRNQEEADAVANIIAARDGIIISMSVFRGVPLCQVGQAVKRGQILVSGYADYGFHVRSIGADAEITALTGRVLTVKTPTNYVSRGALIAKKERFSVMLGKKLINFYKDSGISDRNCVRIYTDYYLVLPGGHQLPVGFVKEQCLYYETEAVSSEECLEFDWLYDASARYIKDTMLAGNVIDSSTSLRLQGGVCSLYGTFQCQEVISRIHKEEILQGNG